MSIPYFPLYVVDFEADTTHLSMEEDGCYNRLLRLCWRTPSCTIPNDPEWIARRLRISAEDFDRIARPVIDEFFTIAEGRLFNPRLSHEFEKINETFQKRSEAGRKGGRPAKSLKDKELSESRAFSEKSRDKAGPKQPEPEPEPDKLPPKSPKGDVPEEFEKFWDAYPHRGGAKRGKAKAIKAFEKALRNCPAREIISAAKAFQSDRKAVEGFSPDPTTWLNNRGWEDDIESARQSRSSVGSQTMTAQEYAEAWYSHGG